jgi:beta-glucosidase
MPPALGVSDTVVLAAVRSGRLDETVMDAAVARVLQLTDRAAEREPLDGFDINAHHALARRAAAESAVLLKNEGHVLPLLPAAGQVHRYQR